MNNQWFSKVAVWMVIALVLFTVFKQFDRGVVQGNQIAYSDFLEEVRGHRIKQVTLQEGASGGTEIVAITTDDKRLPKDRRKRLQVEHAPHLPPRAQMLKMADKISNLSALLASPPAGWSAQRRIDYFDWAREVVEGCRSAHAGLAGMFDELYGQRGHQDRV